MSKDPEDSFAKRRVKVAFVSVESGITALGFRRMASLARRIEPSTDIFFIPVDNLYSLPSHIFPLKKPSFDLIDAGITGRRFSEYDLVCFSAMTASAKHVEAIIAAIRRCNPETFILFGGVHAMIYSDEAMAVSNAICVAEGEKPFEHFYAALTEGRDYTDTPGMWFHTAAGIRKNPPLRLNSNEDLASFPHLYNGLDCAIYDLKSRRFRPFDKFDYTRYNGLTYRTVWSIGCPFSCTFCANDSFIALDREYTKLRFPSPEYMIGEIESAISVHPYLSTVVFYDDNFIALPLKTIQTFSSRYRERIGLPFVVAGMHPNIVNQEKINLLATAGMNRVRMGIQSGNEKMLNFYDRRTPVHRIRASAAIIGEAARKHGMIPPAYDIITDNPVEDRKDVVETLRFLYSLERPYTLTIFGLRVFPKTKLWDYFAIHREWGYPRESNSASYLDTRRTMANILLYVLATARPPARVFEWLLRFVKGSSDAQPEYPILHFLARNVYLAKRAWDHLSRLDFTTIVGRWTYYVWRMGLVGRAGSAR